MSNYLILIDNRELKLKNFFKEFKNIKFKNLEIGDIILKLNEKIVLVIERKTISDLYCSIKDGRYKEQKQRLISNFSKDKILYLIENNIENHTSDFNTDIVYGSIVNMLIRDHIKILKTNNIDETIKYIKFLIKRLETKSEIFNLNNDNNNNNNNNNNTASIDYVNTIKLQKKKNMTPENCQIIQIAQIPGVSINCSKTILETYKSIPNLFLEYNKVEDINNKELLLSNLEIKTINDKKNKKVGKVVSKRIYEYLFKS